LTEILISLNLPEGGIFKVQKGILSLAAVLALGMLLTPVASAQCSMPYAGGIRPSGCPPTGFIYDYAAVTSVAVSPTLIQLTTTFVADNATEDVSFAFREAPNYFAFDNASVVDTTAGSSTNLLADPGFESASFGQNCNDQGQNSLGCPNGWGTWITPEDTSAIGQVATITQAYGCPSDVASVFGTNFWCDGSVQGYDGIYQQLTGLNVGHTYTISWWLGHDDGGALDGTPGYTIDMLVYAGDSLPIGTVPLNTPEPATFALIGAGLAGLAFVNRRRKKTNAV
jgi:hypothetical protein